jgi:hypothetical protein
VSQRGAPTVLRLSASARTRDDRGPELSRLFGEQVNVVVAIRQVDPAAVARQAAELGARAILVDVFRGDVCELRALVLPVPVLRPLFGPRSGVHAGPPTSEFAGYGRLSATGELEPLADLELAEQDG